MTNEPAVGEDSSLMCKKGMKMIRHGGARIVGEKRDRIKPFMSEMLNKK
jgi:hypothetical protein